MSFNILLVATLVVGIASAIPIVTVAPTFITSPLLTPTFTSLCTPILEIFDPLPCNKQLILPPIGVELPTGLGYLPSAAPLVATAYGECCYGPCSAVSATCVTGCSCSKCCSPSVPIVSPCCCTALATPICPNLKPLVKPILL